MHLPAWLAPDVREIDTILFCNSEWGVGEFRMPATHPEFKVSGPFSACYFAFPRTSVVITDARGKSFTSTPSQVNCYGVGAFLQREAVNHLDDNTDYFVVSASLLQSHGCHERIQELLMDSQFNCPPEVYFRQRQLVEALRKRTFPTALEAETAVLNFIHDLIGELLESAEPECSSARTASISTSRNKERMEYVKQLACHTDPAATRLRALAEKANMSPWHLSREFKRHVGESLHQYILKNRLYQSLDRIADRSISLAVIAHDLGFSHHSHFTMSFARLFGCTPTQFRGVGEVCASSCP